MRGLVVPEAALEGGLPSKKTIVASTLRWAAFGPYYAMMPQSFARQKIAEFTAPRDLVLDPFCGRGTIPFAAAELGRKFLGVEIFSVGWIFASTKLAPAKKDKVVARLRQISEIAPTTVEEGEFFRLAFNEKTLRFLCVAREHLNWRRSNIDRTLMAFILVSLHDKIGIGLSNQMRQTKAVCPKYAVRWWQAHGYSKPPSSTDPEVLLFKRIEWRYKKGAPDFAGKGTILLGDSARAVSRNNPPEKASLLFTSPPYYGVTNYHRDQWLRHWMLGGEAFPSSGPGAHCGRFESKHQYEILLETVFSNCRTLMKRTGVICIRTDARTFTFDTTLGVLAKVFPGKSILVENSPLTKPSQTALFGDDSQKPGEVDITLY